MEEMLKFTAVPAITVVVYLAAQLIKNVFNTNKVKLLLPSLCGVMGLVLGVICKLTLPQYIPAENWLTAAACGIISGFAATGVYEVTHKLKPPVSQNNDSNQEKAGNKDHYE